MTKTDFPCIPFPTPASACADPTIGGLLDAACSELDPIGLVHLAIALLDQACWAPAPATRSYAQRSLRMIAASTWSIFGAAHETLYASEVTAIEPLDSASYVVEWEWSYPDQRALPMRTQVDIDDNHSAWGDAPDRALLAVEEFHRDRYRHGEAHR